MKRFLLAALLLASIGCTADSGPERQNASAESGSASQNNEVSQSDEAETATPAVPSAPAVPSERPVVDWRNQLGRRVTLTGNAVNHKVGAVLQGEDFSIYIDLPDIHWPSDLYHGGDDGELVRVTGTVAERSDLPVFIPNPDTPLVAGIAVPAGTDLEEASKRYILESVKWTRVKKDAEQDALPESK